MTGEHLMTLIATWAIYAATPPAVAFPILYTRSPWRSSIVGRAVMTLSVAIALILVASLAYQFIPALPGLPVAAAVLYVWLAFALWRLLVVLARVQSGRDRPHVDRRHVPDRRTSKEDQHVAD